MKSDTIALVLVLVLGAFAIVGFGYLSYVNEKEETAECARRNGLYVCHSDTVWVGGKLGVVETCRCEPKVFR